jgi:tetratricopeptide (TPR) repeat protein
MKKTGLILTVILSLWGAFTEAREAPIDWDHFQFQLSVAGYVYNQKGVPPGFKEEQKKKWANAAAEGDLLSAYILGRIYYSEGDYHQAYKYFMIVSDKCNGPADSYIGYLYANGMGVNVDFDRAIYHYKKVVDSSLGLAKRSQAAIDIASSYQDKHANDKPMIIRRDSPKMREAYMAPAWQYVAYWMGQKTIMIRGTLLKPSTKMNLFDRLANGERENDSLSVSQVKGQAMEICAQIEGCKP